MTNEEANIAMYHSNESSSRSDEQEEITPISQKQYLVTRLQLPLAASHRPRVGRFNLSRRSPDTFATVVSIFQKDGANLGVSRTNLSASSSFENEDEEFRVEWGNTEV